ncbi:hypothetical protein H0H93_016183 [Arthromyces matolae]|nr:hypothetical protein H0H93_016183 [Arthromyces matolae]
MAPPFPTPETSPEMPDNPGPTCTAPLDTFSVTDVIKNLKVSSESLTRIFGQLESQALSVANHGQGGCVFSDTMERFERQLEEQDQAHIILKDHVDAKLLEHLKEIAEREIEEEIDKVVQEQVAEYIATLMPQALQDDVTMQRKELEELRINLLNSYNMFSGSPLNRLSWLRASHPFLNAIISSPTTRWLLFNAGQPLVLADSNSPARQTLAYLTTKDVRPLLGPEPYFGQGKEIGQVVVELVGAKHSPTEAARHHSSPVVFLGLHEQSKANALPSSDFVDAEAAVASIDGTPYFSLDVADLNLTPEKLAEVIQGTAPAQEGQVLSWSEPRILMTGLDTFSGAVFAEARSMVDWNSRNKDAVHPPTRCGEVGNYHVHPCYHGRTILVENRAQQTGLHNYTHPRTDPVVIMIAIDETGDKVLLGRGKRFPGKFYSALAGFIEPGETFEDAVAREMWEEAGVNVWDVRYHSGQPWPYPANLMVGFYARADASQKIRVDLDNELVDAKWFTRAEILEVLGTRLGAQFGSSDYKKMSENAEGRNNQQTPHLNPTYEDKSMRNEPPFRLPPATAIAGVLIRDWVEGKIGFALASKPGSKLPGTTEKNNL